MSSDNIDLGTSINQILNRSAPMPRMLYGFAAAIVASILMLSLTTLFISKDVSLETRLKIAGVVLTILFLFLGLPLFALFKKAEWARRFFLVVATVMSSGFIPAFWHKFDLLMLCLAINAFIWISISSFLVFEEVRDWTS